MNRPSLAPRFLYLFCIGYAGSLILDPSGNLLPYLSMGMIIIGLILGMSSAVGKSHSGVILVIALCIPLAAINSMISTNPTDTSLKWLLWFATILGMYLMAQRSSPAVDDALCKHTAPAFFVIWLVLAVKGNVLAESVKERATSLHLSAFYANLLICSALFLPNKFFRIVFILIGITGALTSGSRAAFLFLPLVFIPGIIYYFKVKFSSIALISMVVGALFFVLQNQTLNALTFGRKAEDVTNIDSMELAERSAGGRAELRQMGLDYILQKPWGYGYGQSFEVVLDGKSLGNNLHNGYLNVATQMGLHLFFAYMAFAFWIYYQLFFNQRIDRRFRFFTLSILSCVFIRAISESFTLFDLGHPAAFFSLFLISLYITRLQNPSRHYA